MKTKIKKTSKFVITLDEREMGILGALVANISNTEAQGLMQEVKKVEYSNEEVSNLLYDIYTVANVSGLVV